MTSALIVIDIQNDFCPGGALAVQGGDEIVPLANALIDEHQRVVLTQDWHPAGHSSFACSHDAAEPFTQIEMPYGAQTLWPQHCVQSTPGAEFHADLNTDKACAIIRKGFNPQLDSYSAFFENDHRSTTGLHGFLRAQGVETLTLCGLATDFCVAWSAIDAARLGYAVSVVESACRAIDLAGSLQAARQAMLEAGVKLC